MPRNGWKVLAANSTKLNISNLGESRVDTLLATANKFIRRTPDLSCPPLPVPTMAAIDEYEGRACLG